MVNKEDLLLLFERPLEPAFVSKGPKNSVFSVPYSYLTNRYKPIGIQVMAIFGDDAIETIPVREIRLPDLGEILNFDRYGHFSVFIPYHRYIAGLLIDLFMAMRNIEELQSMAIYTRDRINPYLFIYAFSVALIHRPDTKDLRIPSLFYSFPQKFIDSKLFVKVSEELRVVPEEYRKPIVIPLEYTASDLEPEHRLWYFREDVGLNLHHWHWHLVYPHHASYEIVNKNRRGELFYYMHQQTIARYNAERLCNSLARVKNFIDWNRPMEEAYFSKINSLEASRNYPARPQNMRLHNVHRDADQLHYDVDDLVQWRDRVVGAIHLGSYINEKGETIPFTEYEGIDVLGNMVEASLLSPNITFYGDLHNAGHMLISSCHDPDGRFLEPYSVMSEVETTMRDPIFYRWHGYLDYIFQKHKASLPRYTASQLEYDGIEVRNLSVKSPGLPVNELRTFFQQADLNLANGMDFHSRGAVYVRITHLQHRNFNYNITVTNSGVERKGTCRIFLAPKFDEGGGTWLFREQKNLFISLDRFTVKLKPGKNLIIRKSTESTVTIPWEQTYRNIEDEPDYEEGSAKFNFCGCGWPHNLLIPKGKPQGSVYQLFVMISNYKDDRVMQNVTGKCNNADNYCGIKDKLYPDRRSMGFPFDRMPRPGVETLPQFLTRNMRVQDVVIRFNNKVAKPKSE